MTLWKTKKKWEVPIWESQLKRAKEQLAKASAVVIGAGSGLSAAAGLTYSGERFQRLFPDFIQRYGMKDMYSAGFYPFQTQEEKWAYWSRQIYWNRYDTGACDVYWDLLDLVKEKEYFVLTTNVDHQFQIAGFAESRIFATQGDYGLFQCAKACHSMLYDNEKVVREMLQQQNDCKIPAKLIPKCPVCGGDMEVHLRCDSNFVEDAAWYAAQKRYRVFLEKHAGERILFWELGVGMNTPVIIKYPFWHMTNQNPKAFYLCMNNGEAWAPRELENRSLCMNLDIQWILKKWKR